MNFINKVKSLFFSPYEGATDSKARKMAIYTSYPKNATEDETVKNSINTLRIECRQLYRNNFLTRSAVDRITLYSVGQGIFPKPTTSDKNWNSKVEKWWKNYYVKNADYRQLNGVDLIDIQKLIVSHRFLDGDIGILLLENGQILPIEAERIVTPNKFLNSKKVINGVRIDTYGKVLGYYVCDRLPSGIDKDNFKYFTKNDLLLCSKTERVDQIRGIPDVAPLITKIKDAAETDKYIRSKIKLDALMTYKVTNTDSISALNTSPRGQTIVDSTGKISKTEELEGSTMHYLSKGQDIEAIDSKTPNATYMDYVIQQQKDISACFGISYEILMLAFTDGNFSSNRTAAIHNKAAFVNINNWIINTCLNKLYDWRIALAIQNKELPPAPKDKDGNSEFAKKVWNNPYFEFIDPLDQTRSDKEAYNMCSKSLKEIAEEHNKDINVIMSEKAIEIKEAIKIANEINSQVGEAEVISWRDIINTSIPGAQIVSNKDVKDITPNKDIVNKEEE